MTRGRTARPDDPPAGVIRRCPDLPMSQWATSPKSVQNREEEQNARHGREPWDSRVLQELPCVPIPRANMMNAVPGYVPGVSSRPGFDFDAGTLFVGNHINTGLVITASHTIAAINTRYLTPNTTHAAPRCTARNFDGSVRVEALLQRSALRPEQHHPHGRIPTARSHQSPLSSSDLAKVSPQVLTEMMLSKVRPFI